MTGRNMKLFCEFLKCYSLEVFFQNKERVVRHVYSPSKQPKQVGCKHNLW